MGGSSICIGHTTSLVPEVQLSKGEGQIFPVSLRGSYITLKTFIVRCSGGPRWNGPGRHKKGPTGPKLGVRKFQHETLNLGTRTARSNQCLQPSRDWSSQEHKPQFLIIA